MDASRLSEYTTKLKLLLENALKPKFTINLNLILSHFTEDENNKEITDALLNLDLLTNWIIETSSYLEENDDTIQPTTNLGRFVFELATLVSKQEKNFVQLSTANAYLRLCDILRVRKASCATEIKLAYVKLLESFLEHKRGVEWIKATNAWIDVLNYSLATNSSDDLVKESCDFLYKLLQSRICYDEEFCSVVVKKITQPLTTNALQNNDCNQNKEIYEQQLKPKLKPTLKLIIALLQNYLNNEWSSQHFKHIPRFLFNNHNLLQTVNTYMLLISNEELNCDFANIVYLIYFISLCIDCTDKMIPEHASTPVFEKVFYVMEDAMNKRYCENIGNLCLFAINYWSVIRTRLSPLSHKDINNDPLLFQLQIIILQLMPVVQFFQHYFKIDWHTMDDLDEMRDHYMLKCMKKMNQYTFKLVYIYREAMVASVNFDYKLATKHIHLIVNSLKYYDDQTAIIVFQMLVYTIHDIVAFVKQDPIEVEKTRKEVDFFMATIYAIQNLIKNFNIKWTNCMETVCVVNTVLDFLLLINEPTKLITETLKLLKLSIENYMSPNLTLLVDRTSDSSLAQLGPSLLSKLQDEHWEVRDGCLQVLTTISRLSHTKFSSFQDLLQQNEYPALVLKLCQNDPESFVRASAFECLQEMVQSDVLWDEFFKQQPLLEIITRILNNETEGIVRLEATALTYSLYLTQHFQKETLPKVYKLMASAATVDLHWEVKTKALEFWDKVIWERLKQQGVMDGNFPEVTFSKQRKKIIKLDKAETKKRLTLVLNKLNTSGCLQVLVNTIQDDADIEVVEAAVKVTKKFSGLLQRYKMLEDKDKFDNKSFFDLIRQDLDKILENRKKWLKQKSDTFGMLLNDMLKDLEQNEDEVLQAKIL